MGSIINFIVSNYIYFVIIGLLVFMALIGYIAEKTNFGRGNTNQKSPGPIKKEPKEEINDNWLEDTHETFTEIPLEDIKPINEYASEAINPELNDKIETSQTSEIIEPQGNDEIIEAIEDKSEALEPQEGMEENTEIPSEPKDFEDAIVDPIPAVNPVIFTDPMVLDNKLNEIVDGKNIYDGLYQPNTEFSVPQVQPEVTEAIDPSLTEPLPEFKPEIVDTDISEPEELPSVEEAFAVTEPIEEKPIEDKPVEEVVEDVWNF